VCYASPEDIVLNVDAINIAETTILRKARDGDSVALRKLLAPYQGDLWQVVAAAIKTAPEAQTAYLSFADKLEIEVQRYTLNEPVGAQLLRSMWHHLLHHDTAPPRRNVVAAMVASGVDPDRLNKILLWDSVDLAVAEGVPVQPRAPPAPTLRKKIIWFRRPVLSGFAVSLFAIMAIVGSQVVMPPPSALVRHTQLDRLVAVHEEQEQFDRLISRVEDGRLVEQNWQSLGPLGAPAEKRKIEGQTVRGYTRNSLSLVIYTTPNGVFVLSESRPLQDLFLMVEQRLSQQALSPPSTTQ
jgi:hypothetical protein